MTTIPLKYRFGCKFADGSTFTAPDDDMHPVLPGRNAFYELLQKDRDGNPIQAPEGNWLLPRFDIREFWVEGEGVRCKVDLRTGRFKLQGAEFIDRNLITPPPGATLHLVWFRRHRVHQNAGLDGQAVGPSWESPIEYHLGWRCYVDGRRHEQTVILT